MKRVVLLFFSLGLLFLWNNHVFAGTKALMDKVCSTCHQIKRPLSKRKNRVDWEKTVAWMANASKNITAEQRTEIINFLSKVRNVDSKIQTPKDELNLDEMEKLHVPLINAPFSVQKNMFAKISVLVGEVEHPMTEEHHIFAIDLYVGGRFENMIELEPSQKPVAEFKARIHKMMSIEVVIHCNVDGIWSTKTEISIE